MVQLIIGAWKGTLSHADRELPKQLHKKFDKTTGFLSFAGLDLRTVPEALRELTDVRALNLAFNELTELPPWIGGLQLKILSATGNRLRQLPREIGELSELRDLWLQHNDLESLPPELSKLPLGSLSLEGNPRLGIPESVLERSPAEILRYYFESREGKGHPLLELKLLVVGRGKAGKTTLLKRLRDDAPDEHESETHSISIHELSFECPRGAVRARAWDFGGQEILHSTHQFFLTERSLYMLVLEPRTNSAQRDAEYWLKLIETQGNGSPVIVVLNWSHDRPWRVDEVKLRRKFPFIVDFISTDAFHGEGIEALRASIIQTVETRMSDVWLPFPNRWREIKDAVATMTGNFLTDRQYGDLCSRFGEVRPEAQADLAGILHALGLALYFGKDPRLHDTRVLNPSWVTGGVYAVIRAASVARAQGQLAVSDMSQVLREAEEQRVINAADYPKETHGFILELMRAFQLCYASEEEGGKPTRYLVPELLSEFEPSMPEAWEESPVRLRYRYEVLPPSLLPRFIVRTHALADGAPHWRHGVVLRHAKASALIREEPDRSEVHVFVRDADDETRRFLVAMVRRELETLHLEMRMQPVEELELGGEAGQWIGVKALHDVERESAEKRLLPVQPIGTAVVDVVQELDKLVPPEVRAIDRDPDTAPSPVRVFVSYAHEDERQLKRLDSILDVLEQQYGLVPWRDRRRLIAGDQWDPEIRQRLEEMDIYLFIASQASLAAPYIRDVELPRAAARYADGAVEIVVVKLEPCASDEVPFIKKFQRLATRYKSVVEAQLRSAAWEQVRLDLLPVVERVRQKKTRDNRRRASV